ncbi:MAG TPA: M23 family metallopeptidase [Acidimicrobiales bacterium]|nr:M23 family metallopeptidase [Acidimicrobiales bacterium]
MRRWTAALALVLVAGAAPAALAQVGDSTTTEVPSTTSTTAAPAAEPPTAVSSTAPADTTLPAADGSSSTTSTTSTTVPPEAAAADEASDEGLPPDAPPDPSVTVPPRAEPAPPPTPEQVEVVRQLDARVEQAGLNARVAQGLQNQADGAVTAAIEGENAATAGLAALEDDKRGAVQALERQRERVQHWAIAAYTGGSLRRVTYVLEVDQLAELPRRLGLASGLFSGLSEDLHDERTMVALLDRRVELATAALDAARAARMAAQAAAEDARAQVAFRNAELAAVAAGQAVSLGGVAFPVGGEHRFGDTFGAPRMTGTPYAHSHEGTDVFAPSGTPVLAFERGVVTRLGTDLLGGIKAWLVGQSGTTYYYAHLLGYAPGLADGQVVEAGQAIGYVGNTGNAATTPAHLHFELHPGGGPAVDPYPTLLQIDEAAKTVAAASPAAPR